MGIESLKMFLIYQKVFKVSVVSFIQTSAVSPEIVPAPESHRSVALLISSQSHITFGRSLSCQGARGNIPLIGRHLESLKKRLFLKLFYFRKNCTTKKAVT